MLPYLTADLPGTGGALKAAPEDFEVEELPLYAASGAGEHLFVRVEKRGRATPEVARELALALGADPRGASWAGLKDAQAVARQWLSVHFGDTARAAGLAGEGWRVLEAARHGNKLRPGHSAGNRFRIRVRGVGPDALAAARAVLDALGARGGAPNFFGPQRFGRRGELPAAGKALLLGTSRERDRFRRKLAISAFQAELFNRWLAERIADGLFGRALLGDVLKKRDSGGLFVCADTGVDQPRLDAGEVDPAGPIFGHKMKAAEAEAALREARILAAEGVTLDTFREGRGEAEGTRRPARVPVAELALGMEEGALIVGFTLPPGAYATVVLREVMKGEVETPEA